MFIDFIHILRSLYLAALCWSESKPEAWTFSIKIWEIQIMKNCSWSNYNNGRDYRLLEQESCNRQEGLYQLRKYNDICIIQIYLCYFQFYKVKTSVTTVPSSLQVSVDTLWGMLMVSLILPPSWYNPVTFLQCLKTQLLSSLT